jgi:hypothetical protein
MRHLSYTLALIVPAALCACTDDPYDPDAPAIDPTAPRIHILSPERGTFAGENGEIAVTGIATDDTLVASVEVNGVAAYVGPDGKFAVTVPVAPGTNLLHAIARDAQGNTGKETRAVVAGPLSRLDRSVPDALTLTMSAQTFNAIGTGAGNFIMDADLGALVQPLNPVVDINTTNGAPDCAYAQARITSLDVGAADVNLVPQSGGIGLDVTLDNVFVGLHLQWAVACLDGSRDVTVSASRLRVTGKLGVALSGGQFQIALQSPNVTITGFNVNLGGIPQTIIDLLDLDTRLGPVLGWATEKFVVPMLNNSLAGLNQTKTIDVLGKPVDITVRPARIEFDVTGALVELDTTLRARDDSAAPGFVYVANTLPAMDKTHGFAIAVADDAANQLLTSFWAAKGMDMTLDLTTGPYGEVGRLYDRVELSAAVPPFVDASGDGLRLVIGDMLATFKNGERIATQVCVNAELSVAVTTDTAGALHLDVGTPTTYVDILDDNVDGANQLSNAEFEAISSFALSRIVAFGSGAVGAIPLPSAGGVGLHDVSITEQTGYLVIGGEIQ